MDHQPNDMNLMRTTYAASKSRTSQQLQEKADSCVCLPFVWCGVALLLGWFPVVCFHIASNGLPVCSALCDWLRQFSLLAAFGSPIAQTISVAAATCFTIWPNASCKCLFKGGICLQSSIGTVLVIYLIRGWIIYSSLDRGTCQDDIHGPDPDTWAKWVLITGSIIFPSIVCCCSCCILMMCCGAAANDATHQDPFGLQP